jgi:hypothetical protein
MNATGGTSGAQTREIVTGTGGGDLSSPLAKTTAGSQQYVYGESGVRSGRSNYGVLRLELTSTGYSWSFVRGDSGHVGQTLAEDSSIGTYYNGFTTGASGTDTCS